VPASPALAKSAATPNPRLPADGKPVLRLEAARDNGGPDNRQNHCCFRLAYELADHGGPALTDEEREKLRQEIRDRLADEDPVARLQSMRIELAALKKQAMAAAAELAAAQARNEQQARDAQATREMVFYAAYMLAAIALGLALWQWLRIKRRRNAEIQQFFAETLATPEPPPAALTTELTPDIPTEGGGAGRSEDRCEHSVGGARFGVKKSVCIEDEPADFRFLQIVFQTGVVGAFRQPDAAWVTTKTVSVVIASDLDLGPDGLRKFPHEG
jgi:hypothetical protein